MYYIKQNNQLQENDSDMWSYFFRQQW